MKVSTMRKVDQWVGLPVCCLLTLWRKATAPLRGRKAPGPVKSILIVKPAEQGATVLAYPAIQQAIQRVGARTFTSSCFRRTGSSSMRWR